MASTGSASAEAADRVRRFFAARAPELLAGGGDRLRTAHGRCCFAIVDPGGAGEAWIVDLAADPPTVAPGRPADGDSRVAATSADFAAMLDDPAAGQVLAWQGRLRLGGDQALLRRVSEVLFPSAEPGDGAYAGYYTALSRLIPDPRLRFMNHGYAEDVDEDPASLDEADRPWTYAINLVRRTLRGARVKGADVLDVGCGRGGPAAYIARTLGARSVVGLDACADAIALCTRQHADRSLRFVHGYADRLPFADASFDVVLNVESSHCYPDRPAFLAEVQRTLRPGGSFCLADIVQPHELAPRETELGALAGLRVAESADVTAEVARAIERNRENLAALLRDATDVGLRNAAIIDHLERSINERIHDNYAAGRWRYRVWRLERAGAPAAAGAALSYPAAAR